MVRLRSRIIFRRFESSEGERAKHPGRSLPREATLEILRALWVLRKFRKMQNAESRIFRLFVMSPRVETSGRLSKSVPCCYIFHAYATVFALRTVTAVVGFLL